MDQHLSGLLLTVSKSMENGADYFIKIPVLAVHSQCVGLVETSFKLATVVIELSLQKAFTLNDTCEHKHTNSN